MASAHDVVQYILQKKAPLSAMKLQKLLYYSQAWSLVFDDAPIFDERIEAWAHGPVVREVYNLHRGSFSISEWPKGDPSVLTDEEKDTIDKVVGFYGEHSAQWLSDLTHSEKPWQEAREGLSPSDRSSREISLASMAEYYGSLPASE